MPRGARSKRDYEREAEQLVERISREMEDWSVVDDEDEWMEHVRRYVFGGLDMDFTPEAADFFLFAREFAQDALTASGYRAEQILYGEIERTVFRDVRTGRFVSRADARLALQVSVFELG